MRLTPRVQVTAVLVGTALLGTLLFIHPPVEGSVFPPCWFHAATGLHCPGCGSTRALAALSHGEIGLAFRNNPLAIVFLALLLPWLLRQAWLGLRHNVFAQLTLPRGVGRAIVIAVALFAVFRNLPWPPFSWLAPVS